MAIVAVAGGTGDVGKTIVEELVLLNKNHVFVLCRKVPATSGTGGAGYVVVDYDDVDSLAKTLESKNIDTVVSAITMEGTGQEGQLNLIAAAEKSSTTKRFIPSEYAGYTPKGDDIDPGDMLTAPLLRAAEALDKTGLTYTRVGNGMFMDYMGLPYVPSYLRPFKWAIDVSSRRAAIPGTGNEPITMTYSRDVARFVARLVEEDKWPQYSLISGSDTTFNHIVALIEETIGDKLEVTYDGLEELKKGKATVLFPGETYGGMDLTVMTTMVGVSLAENHMLLPKEGRLNDKFPEIKPKSIEELVSEAWTGK